MLNESRVSILAFDMGFIGKVWDNLKRSFDTSWIVSCAIMGIIIIIMMMMMMMMMIKNDNGFFFGRRREFQGKRGDDFIMSFKLEPMLYGFVIIT